MCIFYWKLYGYQRPKLKDIEKFLEATINIKKKKKMMTTR